MNVSTVSIGVYPWWNFIVLCFLVLVQQYIPVFLEWIMLDCIALGYLTLLTENLELWT